MDERIIKAKMRLLKLSEGVKALVFFTTLIAVVYVLFTIYVKGIVTLFIQGSLYLLALFTTMMLGYKIGWRECIELIEEET